MVIQFFIIAFVAFAVWRTFLKFKARDISAGWFVFWLVFWIAAGVVVLLPKTTEVAAAWFGVGRGVDLVIYISIIVLFYLIFKIFLKIQSLEKDISKIVQDAAVRYPDKPEEKTHDSDSE